MKKIINKILPFIAVVLFSSCAFEFSDDFYKEIKIEAPTASLSLLNFTDGEVYKKSTSINFEYAGNDKHRLFLIQIFLNGQIVVVTNDFSGSFLIDAQKLSEGKHNIKVEYSFSSGTGSLADINNLENYYVVEEFSFSIDKSLADAFPISNVKIEDGTINVYWEDIRNKNFDKAYLITKYDGSYTKEILLTDDILSTKKYNDNQNTNGKLSYQIRVVNSFKTSESNIVEIEINHPEPSYEIINYNKVKFKWTKHPLYKNFDYYIYNGKYLNNDKEIQLDKNGGELIIDIENTLRLDSEYYTSFILYRNNNSVGVIPSYFYWGNKFELKNVEEYVFDQNTDSYYALDLVGSQNSQSPRKVVIYQLNSKDLSIIRSSELLTVYDGISDLVLDPFSGNLIVDLKKSSLLVDINSLNTLKEYNAKDYFSNESYKVMYRNGRVVINEQYGDKQTYIYNSESKVQLHKLNFRYTQLSDTGNYFWDYKSDIYKIEDSNISKVFTIPATVYTSNLKFIDGQDRCIYNRFYGFTYFLDLKTNIRTQLSTSTEVRNFEYDNITNKVLLRFYGDATLIDLDTDKTYDFEYDSDNEHRGYKLKILNNKLITSKGYYLDYFED